MYRSAISAGAIVRLTLPYLDAKPGVYRVLFVYSNGWLGLESRSDQRRHNIPAHICRLIAIADSANDSQAQDALKP